MANLYSESQYSTWYEEIAKIRIFEETIAKFYPKEIFRCPIHLAIGHEASAVGVCSALSQNDLVLGNHRSHHHYLAKGGSAQALLFELLGDSRGCSGGRGGSTHLFSPDVGFLGSTAIISGTIPVATGVAHSLKLKKSNNIVVCFSGDASIEEGVYFEALNIASLWKLPILFVIEDNDLSCYTAKNSRQSITSFSKIAELFDLFYDEKDGEKVQEIYSSSIELIEKIKQFSKPGILKVNVYRAHEHCGPDSDNHLLYREVEGHWPNRDPLINLANHLTESKIQEILKKVSCLNAELFNNTFEMKNINEHI
jgi:pyruvate dehydrogenase E1 component alpha subunit